MTFGRYTEHKQMQLEESRTEKRLSKPEHYIGCSTVEEEKEGGNSFPPTQMLDIQKIQMKTTW